MPFDVADLGVDVTDVAVATVGGHVQVAASSSDAEGKMYFYRLGGAEDLVSLEGDLELQEPVTRFKHFSANGFATGGPRGTICAYQYDGDGRITATDPVEAHDAAVTGIDLRPGGSTSVSVCDQGSLAAVDAAAQAVVRKYANADPVSLSSVAMSSLNDRDCVLTAGAAPRAQLKLWDLRSASKVAAANFRHPFSGAAYTTLSPNPTHPHQVLAGTTDGEVVWFDLRRVQEQGSGNADVVACLKAHEGDVLALRHHPVAPQYFFSAGADGALLLIEGDKGNCYAERLGNCGVGVHALAVHTESNSIVGASRNEQLLVVQGVEQTAAGSRYYNMSMAE
mmetsp:Transcript_20849/g.63494  ORF Transcript_20849/g.63494 Transcript_20849/m.63494 type:complete len:337 (-) Transcript_20849:923-1933(-)